MTGIGVSNEMDEKDLPSALISTAKRIMENTKLYSLPLNLTPRGAADHYTYKISIMDGTIRRVIECNQYDLHDDLKLLIKYVEKHPNKIVK